MRAFHNLDLLRAVAVLMVLYAHVWPETRFSGGAGRLGVLVFFVHTSLVLLHSMEKISRQRNWISMFYIRRAFRLYPLAVLVIGASYLFHSVTGSGSTLSLRDLWPNLLLLQNLFWSPPADVVFWSLPLEVEMYVLLPFLFLGLRNRGVWTVAALWLATAFIGLLPIPWKGYSEPLQLIAFAPCFIAGAVAYVLLSKVKIRWNKWLWPVALAGVCGLYLGLVTKHSDFAAWISTLAIGILIPFFDDASPNSFLSNAAGQVAKYSYGIYVAHVNVIRISFERLHSYPEVLQWGVFLVFMVTIPVMVHHLVEQPLIDLGKRITQPLHATVPPRTLVAKSGT